MGRILEYIQKSGNGKYLCYKTKKLSLDANDSDTLAYDDKARVQTTNSKIAETDRTRQPVFALRNMINNSILPPPIFHYFLDGSRHTYKVDDISIGKKIFPIVAGQIIVGCCERKDRDTFKKFNVRSRIVLSMPDDFDTDSDNATDSKNFCRSYCEGLNKEIGKLRFISERGLKIDKLLLYRTDSKTGDTEKDNYKNSAVAIIQNEMVDEEQLLVAELCRQNKLDDEHWLIKDGSLEYNPSYSNLDSTQWNNLRINYQHVVGVSKQFDPELLPDYEGNSLAKTIANLNPFERTKVYRYEQKHSEGSTFFGVWYLRLRNNDFRETNFSDVVKCEMVLLKEDQQLDSDIVNVISANLIREAYPVCFGSDTRWANHLYPVFLTETFCKSHYINSNVILSLF
jgi:hypothetical protein